MRNMTMFWVFLILLTCFPLNGNLQTIFSSTEALANSQTLRRAGPISVLRSEMPKYWSESLPEAQALPMDIVDIRQISLNEPAKWDLELLRSSACSKCLPFVTPSGFILWQKESILADSLPNADDGGVHREEKEKRIRLILQYLNALSLNFFGPSTEREIARNTLLRLNQENDKRAENTDYYSGPFLAYENSNAFYVRTGHPGLVHFSKKHRLARIIQQVIHHRGEAMPFDEYMDFGLYDPNFGFYQSTREILGNFTTVPEIYPSFSAEVTHDLVKRYISSNKRDLVLTEMGAGSGINTYRILLLLYWQAYGAEEVRKEYPVTRLGDRAFFQKLWAHLKVNILEAGAGLRMTQKTKLSYFESLEFPKSVTWINSFQDVQKNHETFYYVFGNEIPDAFPAKAFKKVGDHQYRELAASLNQDSEITLGYFGRTYSETDPTIQEGLFADIDRVTLTQRGSGKIKPGDGQSFIYSLAWLSFYKDLLTQFRTYAMATVFIDYVRDREPILHEYNTFDGYFLNFLIPDKTFGFRYFPEHCQNVESLGTCDITYSPTFNNSVKIARDLGFSHIEVMNLLEYSSRLDSEYKAGYRYNKFFVLHVSSE